MLVNNLAAEWDPSKYTDEYRENLMKLIKARMKGQRPKLTGEAPEPQDGKVVDLMERLRQSLEQQGGKEDIRRAQEKIQEPSRGMTLMKNASRTDIDAAHRAIDGGVPRDRRRAGLVDHVQRHRGDQSRGARGHHRHA